MGETHLRSKRKGAGKIHEAKVGACIDEKDTLMPLVRLRLSKLGGRIFRNTVAVYRLFDGSMATVGLGTGSSDLIGWTSVVITADMIGKKLAVFTAAEVKTMHGRTQKKRLEEQTKFINVVKEAGGIAGFIRCEQDCDELLSPYVRPNCMV